MDPETNVALSTTVLALRFCALRQRRQEDQEGHRICEWDPYNNVIISEEEGTVAFESIEEGVTYREELDEQTGFREIVITESRDKKKNPAVHIMGKKKEVLRTYSLPVGAHLSVKEGDKVGKGLILCKIPRLPASLVTSRGVFHV